MLPRFINIVFLLWATVIVSVAQTIDIGVPAPGDALHSGSNTTVRVDKPVRLTLGLSLFDVNLAIGYTDWLNGHRHCHHHRALSNDELNAGELD